MNKKALKIVLLLVAALFIHTVFIAPAMTQRRDEDLKRKIGQMLIVGFRGTTADENSFIVKAIKDLGLGGAILFDRDGPTKSYPRNIINAGQLKELISQLKKASSAPLFVAVDAEGGRVNRLKPAYGFLAMPSHGELGDANDLRRTKSVSAGLAKELSDIGFNLNFAPVVDVNVNPENPVIGALGRSFSSDEKVVTANARAFIEGQHEFGMITAIKHFPGHGSSGSDSHKGLVDVTGAYQDKEIEPFQELIKSGDVDMIMTAHIINKKIDPTYPATLSGHHIQDVLRKQFGFEGVVVSDDMQMGAIRAHYGFEEALIRAINAGCDLLIISNNGDEYNEMVAYQASEIIFRSVKSGRISARRIKESFDRLMELKKKLSR